MTCWGKWNATWHFYFHAVCWCLSAVEILIEQLHEALDVQSCLFALKLVVAYSSTEEGMIAFTRTPLCTSLWCVTAQTQEPELITAARVNACVGFIPARFWTVPEVALWGVYTAICHGTSKTVKTPFIILISWKKNYIFIYCIRLVHMQHIFTYSSKWVASGCFLKPKVDASVSVQSNA